MIMLNSYLSLISSIEFIREMEFENQNQVKDCLKFLSAMNLLTDETLDYLLLKFSNLPE